MAGMVGRGLTIICRSDLTQELENTKIQSEQNAYHPLCLDVQHTLLHSEFLPLFCIFCRLESGASRLSGSLQISMCKFLSNEHAQAHTENYLEISSKNRIIFGLT